MGHSHTHSHNHSHSHTDHTHTDHSSHGHGHGHSAKNQAPRLIVRAIVITFIFMAIELVGGWMSNSLALISDAAHMLIDIGAMLLSLFAIWVARRPSTPKMSFGYHRAEILGALFSAFFIWLIAGWLIYEAIQRMQAPPEVQGPMVFAVATIGLAANLFSMWMLHDAKNENINVRATYLHLLSDSLGSLGAVIAGIVLWVTDWRPIDPIITIVFAALMLMSSWSLVKEALEVLMESTPTHINPDEIKADLQGLTSIQEVHDLHIWSVSSGRLALSVHLVSPDSENILERANHLLQTKYNILHTTIQVEHPDQFQSERCYDCVSV